jgi:hypothetical protein
MLLDLWKVLSELADVSLEISPTARHVVVLSIRDEDNVKLLGQSCSDVVEKLNKSRENVGATSDICRCHVFRTCHLIGKENILCSQLPSFQLFVKVMLICAHRWGSVLNDHRGLSLSNDDVRLLSWAFHRLGTSIELRAHCIILFQRMLTMLKLKETEIDIRMWFLDTSVVFKFSGPVIFAICLLCTPDRKLR